MWLFFPTATELIAVPRPALRIVGDRLHAADGPAVSWPNGKRYWFWHGTQVSQRVIETPESFSADELRAERNSEVSRALAERLGWERYLAALGTRSLDVWIDPHTGLRYELLDLLERRGDRQPRWLRMLSPTLIDGTQPQYIEPVDPGLRTAAAARRWQFRDADGDWPTVAACNKAPRLQFAEER